MVSLGRKSRSRMRTYYIYDLLHVLVFSVYLTKNQISIISHKSVFTNGAKFLSYSNARICYIS